MERAAPLARLLEGNLAACGLGERARVRRGEVGRVLRSLPEGSADLVLADPPYGVAWPGPSAWAEIERILAPGGSFVLEHASAGSFRFDGAVWLLGASRVFGDTRLEFLERKEGGDG